MVDPNAEEAAEEQFANDQAKYNAAVASGQKVNKGKKGKPTRMNAANTVARARYAAATPEVKAEIEEQIKAHVEEKKSELKKKQEELGKADLVMKRVIRFICASIPNAKVQENRGLATQGTRAHRSYRSKYPYECKYFHWRPQSSNREDDVMEVSTKYPRTYISAQCNPLVAMVDRRLLGGNGMKLTLTSSTCFLGSEPTPLRLQVSAFLSSYAQRMHE